MINFKRFVSGILSLVMMLVMFESIPVYAKTGTETYTYEGYTVEYLVSNEWTGNQSVEVKITNTGEESILNWALKYDAKGEVSGLWNAVSVSNEGNAYLIKNAGYNYEIAPNGSVSFGYTLSGENLSVPDDFELCSKRVDTKEENYTAVLDITEEWDTGFKAELIVSNVSDSPIEAWRFSFDSNFTVSDIWDCRLLENTDGRYTVASEAWINPIQPGSSVTIGIVGIKEEGKAPEISGVTLSEVVIDDTLPEVQKPVGEMFIAAFGEYIKETETIDILWMSTQTEGTFEILMSDDNEEYTVAGSVQNADNYSIPADFVKKYIKVRQTNGNQTAESEPFVVMMTPTGYTVDFIDSDNDGLYDYIEDAVGTDKNLSDTDNDDLTDYEEVYLLGTDPVVYDSIVSGTSDGDADSDNDGLSNRYELDNGTNPLCDDTDSDGLTDGEEIGTYGTDPVKYDTDEDNIGDGDEITLGLNPLDSSTDGTPDSERIFEQKITSDSDIMSHINTEDNAFSMSINISAAGNAENSISVSESGYSAVIQSDAVLGTIPEISYASGLSVEEVRVNFEIKDEYLENTLGTYSDCEELSGIKRLNIFRYFEEENILLPIETKFDIENNMVYTDVDMVGTYCLIDMEKWFESIGVDFESEVDSAETYSESQTMSFDEIEMLNDNGDDIGVNFDKIYDKDGKNIIHLMYEPYINGGLGWEHRIWSGIDLIEQRPCENVNWGQVRPVVNDEILDKWSSAHNIEYVDVVVFSAVHSKNYKSEMLNGKWIINKFKEMEYLYGNIHFYVYNIDGTVITTKTGKEYAETLEEVKDIVSNVDKHSFVGEKSDLVLENAFEFYKNKDMMFDISLLNDILYLGDFKDNYYKWGSIHNHGSALQYGGIKEGSSLYEETDKELNRMMFNNIILANQNPVIFVAYCYYKPEEKPLQIITATGLEPLPVDFDSKADYDNDGLLNTKEIDWNSPLIKDKSLKTYESLPTVQECIGYKKELTYVENGLKRLQILPGSVYSELITKRILPINSDPLSVDGDGDRYLDCLNNEFDKSTYGTTTDPRPLKKDLLYVWLNNKYPTEIDKGYFGVEYDGRDKMEKSGLSYGGNQHWIFEDSAIYNSFGKDYRSKVEYIKQLSDEEYKSFIMENSGCGITATVDLLAYLSLYNSNYSFETNLEIDSYGNVVCDSYLEFYKMIANDYLNYSTKIPDRNKIITNIAGFESQLNELTPVLGVGKTEIKAAIEAYIKDNTESCDVKFYSIKNFQEKEHYINAQIKKSLSDNKPVILSLVNESENELTAGAMLYHYDGRELGILEPKQEIHKHAIMITGIVEDNVNNMTYYIVSSWGGRYMIKSTDLRTSLFSNESSYYVIVD